MTSQLVLLLYLLTITTSIIAAPSIKAPPRPSGATTAEAALSIEESNASQLSDEIVGRTTAANTNIPNSASNSVDNDSFPAAYDFINAKNVSTEDTLDVRQYPPRVRNSCDCYYRDSCGCLCRQPITWEEFQLLPQNFRSCRGFTLALRGGQFHSFSSDYFRRVGAVQEFVLDVSEINFQYLLDPGGEASPFNQVSFDTSVFIRIHKVTVSRSWNWASFNDLTPTRRLAYCEIQVVQSTVPILTQDFGRICKGAVTVVNVNYCSMMALENRVFVPFYKLNEVDLSNNRVRVMLRSYFLNPANELESINLSYNDIRSLPSDMFTNMPALSSVDLKGNPITTLQEATFRPIFRNVAIVGLETFPLSCDCRARWMKDDYQLYGSNVQRLSEAVCQEPSNLQGLSFFNETLAKDLIC